VLYWLSQFADVFGPLNVFRYITFRTGGAVLTALLFVFLFGPAIIRWLRVTQGKGQPIRDDGPQSHLLKKKGTPTMGGLMILSGLIVATLLWANLNNRYVWVVVAVAIGFGAIGFFDDYLKVTSASAQGGLSGRLRLGLEALIAGAAVFAITELDNSAHSTALAFPFFKDLVIDLGLFFIVLGIFVIVGAGNAVNLTDGLDGLAIGPVMVAAGTFAAIAYLVGNAVSSDYLQIKHVPGVGELTVVCGAVIGAGLGFLWFNAPPASIFMGDTGSLSLGGLLGAIAVATKHEIAFAIIGGLFVVEAISVIVQVVSFKLRGSFFLRFAVLNHDL
jgi:phospho-N-acetylmuramoyl-pentapeptide-transferase